MKTKNISVAVTLKVELHEVFTVQVPEEFDTHPASPDASKLSESLLNEREAKLYDLNGEFGDSAIISGQTSIVFLKDGVPPPTTIDYAVIDGELSEVG